MLRKVRISRRSPRQQPAAKPAAGPQTPSPDQEAPRSPFGCLTRCERGVAMLAVEGHTRGEMARNLGISEETVKLHLKHIHKKLGIKRRCELVKLWLESSPSGGSGGEPQP